MHIISVIKYIYRLSIYSKGRINISVYIKPHQPKIIEACNICITGR